MNQRKYVILHKGIITGFVTVNTDTGYDVLLKAGKKDVSKLTKKIITDKNGVQRTVYVRVGETPKKESWLTIIAGFFGFKSTKHVMEKVDKDYKEHEIDKRFNLTWEGWKVHLQEYFLNKEKWDKFFSIKKAKKKGEKENKERVPKTSKIGMKLSVLKFLYYLYGAPKIQHDAVSMKPEPDTTSEKVPEKESENSTGTNTEIQPYEMTSVEYEYERHPESIGDAYSLPKDGVGIMRGFDEHGNMKMYDLDHKNKFLGSYKRDELKLIRKLSFRNTSQKAADKWLHDMVKEVEDLEEKNRSLLNKVKLYERFKRGVEDGESTHERFVELQNEGALISDEEYQRDVEKVAKVEEEIEKIKHRPILNTTNEEHKNLVKQALKEGKKIPDRVLEEYPDLKKLYYDNKKISKTESKEVKNKRDQDDNFNTMPDQVEDNDKSSKESTNEDLKNGTIVPLGIETGNGSKIETNKKVTKKQDEESKNDEKIAARDGYYNEKPAEVLNVGADVWGAARHKFDTYEKFNADVSKMEIDGTAHEYVNKKNLIGEYGLANKEERVKNGETEFKVLASFAIREYLQKVPEDNKEARSKYMEFCRSLVRLDEETTTASDYLRGLAEVYNHLFDSDKKTNEKGNFISILGLIEKPQTSELVLGKSLKVFLNTLSGNSDRTEYYSMSTKEKKQLSNLTNILIAENGDKKITYDDIRVDLLGASKATGLKIKKGDVAIFTDNLKDSVYLIKTSFASKEDANKHKEITEQIHDLNNMYNTYRYNEKNRQKMYEYFKTTIENVRVADEKIREEIRRLFAERDTYITNDYFYPEKKGQIVKVGIDTVQVSFEFPDGKIRTFNVKPSVLKEENIESIQKSISRKPTRRVDLYIESHVERTGGKEYDSINVNKAQSILEKDYGFKALQYGNSMDEAEREYHTRWTLQAFSDLSEVLNLPLKLITANGKLGIAFGARGKGGGRSGKGALAHYEPGTKMINLTRSNGFGSLAHEWGHFLDNVLSPGMNGFLSINQEYVKKHVTSPDEIKHGSIYIKQKGNKQIRYFFDRNAKNPRYPFAKLNQGQSEPDNNSHYVGLYTSDLTVLEPIESRSHQLATEIGKLSIKSLREQTMKKMEEFRANNYEAFLEDAYFNNPIEGFARAFESYVADKLEDNGRKNTYLSSKKKTIGKDGKIIYPQNEYRKQINRLFDEFFDEIRSRKELEKAIKLFGTLLKAGKKDLLKLTKKVITDKNGIRRTVYVRVGEEIKKGGLFSGILSFFGFKNDKQAQEKAQELYSKHKAQLPGVDLNTFTSHMNEYLANKEKWDKKFSSKEKKEPSAKKESAVKPGNNNSVKTSKGTTWNVGLMKKIANIVGGVKKEESKEKSPQIKTEISKKEALRVFRKDYQNNSDEELKQKLDINSWNVKPKFWEERVQAIKEILKERESRSPAKTKEQEWIPITINKEGLRNQLGKEIDPKDIKETFKVWGEDVLVIQDGKSWNVIEKKTGTGIRMGASSKKNAIELAKQVLDKYGKEKFKNAILSKKQINSGSTSESDKKEKSDKNDFGDIRNPSRLTDTQIYNNVLLTKKMSMKTLERNADIVAQQITMAEKQKKPGNVIQKLEFMGAVYRVAQLAKDDKSLTKEEIVSLVRTGADLPDEPQGESDKENKKDVLALSSSQKYVDTQIAEYMEGFDERYNGARERGEDAERIYGKRSDYKEKIRKQAENYINGLIAKIDNKEYKNLIDSLHMDNKNSRKIFEEYTGITLGSNNASTKETIKKFVGEAKVKEVEAQQKSEKEAQAQQVKKNEFNNAVKRLESRKIRYEGNVFSGKEYIEHIANKGGEIVSEKFGNSPIPKTRFYFKDDSFVSIKNKDEKVYLESLLNKKGATKETTKQEKEAQAQYDKANQTIETFESEYDKSDYKSENEWDYYLKETENEWKEDIKHYEKSNSYYKKAHEGLIKLKEYKQAVKELAKLKDSDALMGPKLFKARLVNHNDNACYSVKRIHPNDDICILSKAEKKDISKLIKLEKGRKLEIGTVRTRKNGKKYQKVADGKWKVMGKENGSSEDSGDEKNTKNKNQKKGISHEAKRKLVKNLVKSVVEIVTNAFSGGWASDTVTEGTKQASQDTKDVRIESKKNQDIRKNKKTA